MNFQADAETKRINIDGVIGDEITFEAFSSGLSAMNGGDVTIDLQSPGGDVMTGFRIANAITNYPGNVTVQIDSLAASIATVFPMRADRIVANSNATLMIHNAWGTAVGDKSDMMMTADLLGQLDSKIAKEYANRTGKSESLFAQLMDSETFFHAEDAKDLGLVDEVIGPPGVKANNFASVRPVATISASVNCQDINDLFAASVADEGDVIPRPRAARVEAMLASMRLKL